MMEDYPPTTFEDVEIALQNALDHLDNYQSLTGGDWSPDTQTLLWVKARDNVLKAKTLCGAIEALK